MTFLVSVRKLPLAGRLRNTCRCFISSPYVLYSSRLPSVRTDLYFSRTSLASFTFNGYALPFSCTELSHRTLPEPLCQLRYLPCTYQRNVHLYLLLTAPCSHRSYLISSLSLASILPSVTPPDSVLYMPSTSHPFPSKSLPYPYPNTGQSIPTLDLSFISPSSPFYLLELH